MAEKTKKTSAKKTATKKIVAKKTSTKKVAKKCATKKPTTKKVATKKAPAKKVATKKTVKKAPIKKSVKKASKIEDVNLEIVKKCWKILDDKKAEDLKVLDVRGKSSITNYLIIATATSDPHLNALSNELEKTLKENGFSNVGREYTPGSGWVVVGGCEFMAHIFLTEQRGMYGLEALWKDADLIEF